LFPEFVMFMVFPSPRFVCLGFVGVSNIEL
jgi:hypothetical protein